MYKILIHENQKVSAAKGEPEKIESDFEIYQTENMSIEDTKENLNDVRVRLNSNLKIHTGLKIGMI